MKPPKPLKPPKIPTLPMPISRGAKIGFDRVKSLRSFAYHPPAEPSRMRRPKGGHGPHNPET